ncbi:MAG: ferredoxin family protein [Candidatus Bathyarchaeota archaeon]
MPPVFNENCVKCFKCVEVCPGDVLREGQGGPVLSYPDECWHCGACMMDCLVEAVRLSLPLWMRPVAKRVDNHE